MNSHLFLNPITIGLYLFVWISLYLFGPAVAGPAGFLPLMFTAVVVAMLAVCILVLSVSSQTVQDWCSTYVIACLSRTAFRVVAEKHCPGNDCGKPLEVAYHVQERTLFPFGWGVWFNADTWIIERLAREDLNNKRVALQHDIDYITATIGKRTQEVISD